MKLLTQFKYSTLVLTVLALALMGCDPLGGGSGGKSDSTRLNIDTDVNNGNGNGNGNGQGDFCSDSEALFTVDFSSIYPADGAEGVSKGASVVVKFSHEPDPNSLRPDVIGLEEFENGKKVTTNVTIDGKTVTFKPTDPLQKNTKYRFYLKADGITSGPQASECAAAGMEAKFATIVDSNGDPKVGDDDQPITEDETTFETGDGNFLEVISTHPENGKTAGTDVKPSITFNQPLDESTVNCSGPNAVIHLGKLTKDDQEAITSVSGSCEVSEDGTTVTFTPDPSPLAHGADYRVTIDASQLEAEDNGALPLDNDYVFEFSTSSLLNTRNCEASVAGSGDRPGEGICLLGGDEGGGLVDLLLDDETGPLAPLAGQIGGKDKLVDILTNLLASDDGSLQGIVEGLLIDGQLQDGLEALLLSEAGLQAIVPELLMGDGEGKGGLEGLLGTEGGVASLLQALLIDGGNDDACKSAIGTVCLVGGEDKHGLLEALLDDNGYLGQEGLSEQELVNILAGITAGDGSLGDLVNGLFMEGQLQDGLEALLIGEIGEGGMPGIAGVLADTLGGAPELVGNVLAGLLGGAPGDLEGDFPGLGDIPIIGGLLGGLLGGLIP